jgi:hypothetical protein
VELAPDRADDLGEPPLDRHVDVLVVLGDDERVGIDLVPDRVEARSSSPRSSSLMMPLRASIRACARDCSRSYGASR